MNKITAVGLMILFASVILFFLVFVWVGNYIEAERSAAVRRCVFSVILLCDDWRITSNSVELKLTNGMEEDIVLRSINLSGDAVNGNCYYDTPTKLSKGIPTEITVPCSLDSTKITGRRKYEMYLNYSWSNSTDTHSLYGELIDKSR